MENETGKWPVSEVLNGNCHGVQIGFEMCLSYASQKSVSWNTWTSFASSYFTQYMYLPVSGGFNIALNIIPHRSLPRKAREDSQSTSTVRL